MWILNLISFSNLKVLPRKKKCHLWSEFRVKMYPSQRSYNPRAVKRFWQPFIRCFQFFCISHYSTFYATNHIDRMIYYIVFSALHIALMFYTLFNGLHIHLRPSDKYKSSPLMFYVNFASVTGSFITHIVAHSEPLFTRKDEEEIYRKLSEINDIFATKLNYVTDFKIIRKKFLCHTMVFFLFSASLSFAYSFFSLPSNGFNMIVFLVNRVLSIVIIRTRRCQMTFLINTMSNILADLQILLKRQQKNYRPNSTESMVYSCENIRYLRDIYSNVWLLKNLISNCFGFSFISLLMEFSFDLINSSYWAYMNIKIFESSNLIIRKILILLKHTIAYTFYSWLFQKSVAIYRQLSWISGISAWCVKDVRIWFVFSVKKVSFNIWTKHFHFLKYIFFLTG